MLERLERRQGIIQSRWARSMGLIGQAWVCVASTAVPRSTYHHLCDNDDSDIPPVPAVGRRLGSIFRAIYWLGGNTSRLQDLKGVSVEKIFLDFEVNLDFTHPASLDNLFELLLDESGFERTKTGLELHSWTEILLGSSASEACCRPRKKLTSKVAFFRAVWRGLESGTDAEVFHVGVEKRRLKPFIQMPVQRSSKHL